MKHLTLLFLSALLFNSCNELEVETDPFAWAYPNPVQGDAFLNLHVQLLTEAEVTVTLHSNTGGTTQSQVGSASDSELYKGHLEAGPNILRFDLSNNEEGLYHMDVQVGKTLQRLEILKTNEE